MIYNVQQVGNNQLILNETVPAEGFILAVLFVPCNNTSTDINGDKKVILGLTICNGFIEVDFEGVAAFYEDLLSGLIFFEDLGTWKADIYYQASSSNVNVNAATLLDTIELQVIV